MSETPRTVANTQPETSDEENIVESQGFMPHSGCLLTGLRSSALQRLHGGLHVELTLPARGRQGHQGTFRGGWFVVMFQRTNLPNISVIDEFQAKLLHRKLCAHSLGHSGTDERKRSAVQVSCESLLTGGLQPSTLLT